MTGQSNILDLCAYRRAKFPTHEEIMAHFTNIQTECDPLESQIAENLLLMYECGMLKVTRDARGEFLYALQNEDTSEGGRSGAVQDIVTTRTPDEVAENVRQTEDSGRDSE